MLVVSLKLSDLFLEFITLDNGCSRERDEGKVGSEGKEGISRRVFNNPKPSAISSLLIDEMQTFESCRDLLFIPLPLSKKAYKVLIAFFRHVNTLLER